MQPDSISPNDDRETPLCVVYWHVNHVWDRYPVLDIVWENRENLDE